MISWAGALALCNFMLLLALFGAGAILLKQAARHVGGSERREQARW
jgi:hypothetical protein